MKKILLVSVVLCVSFISCVPDPADAAIKASLAERYNDTTLAYKLIGYNMVDTLFYGDMLRDLAVVDKAQFTKQRNQEFTTFRMNGKEYERDIMVGKLKDVSEWCTELRLITERADKVLADFDNVKRFNFEYQYLSAWYMARFWNFCDNSDAEHKYQELMAFITSHPHIFTNTESLTDEVVKTPFLYVIKHRFSLVDKDGNRITHSEELVLNEDYKISH